MYNYQNVKRWSQKVPGEDIFTLDCIYCPINFTHTHWCLLVIDMTKKEIAYFDSGWEKMDPDGALSRQYVDATLRYLQDEWANKMKQGLFNPKEWKLIYRPENYPQQGEENGWDCGVFTCINAYYMGLNLNVKHPFDEGDMEGFRKIMAFSILSTKNMAKDDKWTCFCKAEVAALGFKARQGAALGVWVRESRSRVQTQFYNSDPEVNKERAREEYRLGQEKVRNQRTIELAV